MPKGKWIPREHGEHGNIEFEYVYAQNYASLPDKHEIIVSGYKNGTLREVKQKVWDTHYEDAYWWRKEAKS